MAFDGKWWVVVAMVVVASVSGCIGSSYRVVPGQVGVQVEAPDVRCGGGHREIPVRVRVHNAGRGILRITINGASGPPYPLSWLSYDVLDSAGNVEWRHGPGGHGPLPQPTLTMESGDHTVLSAKLYDIGEADFSRSFRIRLEDEEKHTWTTDAFRPCVQRD